MRACVLLIAAIASRLNANAPLRDSPQITNMRHIVLVERARASMDRAVSALEGEVPEQFVFS